MIIYFLILEMRRGDVQKELGRMWANLEAEIKGNSWAEAKRRMDEYNIAVKNYSPSEAFLKEKEAHENSLKIKKIKVEERRPCFRHLSRK